MSLLQRLQQAARRYLLAAAQELPAAGWVEVERNGFCWRLCMDCYLDREIARRGVFEAATTRLVERFVRPGMRVLDVGANIGYFTLLFARLVGPTGHVWAVEPARAYRERLLGHLEANRLSDRVTVLDFGLSDHDGEATISVGESSATLHPVADVPARGSETIRLRTLDAVVREAHLGRLDLIKIDVDGHEPAVLRGAVEYIGRHHPPILIEFCQESLDVACSDARTLREQLLDLGYVLHSEQSKAPFADRRQFLKECANFSHSANVWALPPGAVLPCD